MSPEIEHSQWNEMKAYPRPLPPMPIDDIALTPPTSLPSSPMNNLLGTNTIFAPEFHHWNYNEIPEDLMTMMMFESQFVCEY